ncbi:histone deacetylase [Tianweitania sp. BSSL-BM11]|uniref:Histone deacetylase n=1 Tax=Tianweitania aestuarii TaxID=2814886 RepID=A0ABS5RQJ1_9HYPH|nr:histone deacetylase [Tianweitania aestuarii]MBS9719276.1 histone deacetylase [Tianweitania aestuarii]
MRLPIVHHPDYDAKFDPAHRFPMGKYSALMRVLEARGLVGADNLHQPDLLHPSLLKLAHSPAYIDQVVACAVPPAIERDIGFPVSERVSRRAQLATAGTLMAARIALESGIACNAAGGSHHARQAQGAGFCTLNDVAVASLALLSSHEVHRILIVDLDVHQGDGTADILGGERRAFTFSMHGARNYPMQKAVSDLDVPLDDALDDAAYLETLGQYLPGLLHQQPDLVFYNAGVDPHRDDRLGRLCLTDDGLRARDRFVIETVRAAGVPLCGVIGGGYSRDVDAVAARHAILFETAAAFA